MILDLVNKCTSKNTILIRILIIKSHFIFFVCHILIRKEENKCYSIKIILVKKSI